MSFKRTPQPPERPEPKLPEARTIDIDWQRWETLAKKRGESVADLVFDRPWEFEEAA